MKVDGVPRRSIQLAADGETVEIVDQTGLPHRFETRRLATLEDAAAAIRDMRVRGAPLIGATAAYGLCFAVRRDPSTVAIEEACSTLLATRPTAVNLRWAMGDGRHEGPHPRRRRRTSGRSRIRARSGNLRRGRGDQRGHR